MVQAKEAGRTSVLLTSNTQVKELPTSGAQGILRMDGAQLNQEQSRSGTMEAPHPTRFTGTASAAGTKTRVEVSSSESKAVSAEDLGPKR